MATLNKEVCRKCLVESIGDSDDLDVEWASGIIYCPYKECKDGLGGNVSIKGDVSEALWNCEYKAEQKGN